MEPPLRRVANPARNVAAIAAPLVQAVLNEPAQGGGAAADAAERRADRAMRDAGIVTEVHNIARTGRQRQRAEEAERALEDLRRDYRHLEDQYNRAREHATRAARQAETRGEALRRLPNRAAYLRAVRNAHQRLERVQELRRELAARPQRRQRAAVPPVHARAWATLPGYFTTTLRYIARKEQLADRHGAQDAANRLIGVRRNIEREIDNMVRVSYQR